VADSDILRGAELMAASRMLGLSEDETIKLIQRKNAQNNRRRGTRTSDSRAAGALQAKLDQVAALNAELPANIDEYRTIPNREVEFGEFGNQDELQNFGGLDKQGNIKNIEAQIKEREQAAGKKDPNVLVRNFFEKGKEGLQKEEMYIPDGMAVPDRFVEAAKNRDFGIYQEGVNAPAAQVQRMERDILQQGIDQYGADAFPGAADVIGRIEDDIYGNRGAERALVREMVGQDINGLPAEEIRRRADLQLGREFYQPDGGTGAEGKPYKRIPNVAAMPVDAYKVREAAILSDLGRIRQNAEMVEANNWRAQAAANIIGQDFQIGGRGARADQAIENIGHIAKIGHAKIGNDFQVEPTRVTDDLNAPVTDNRFAGPLQKQEQFIVDNMPGYREGGLIGAFPNVGINEQIGLARQAIENAKIKGQQVSLGDMQIRNAADLQAAADQVIGLAQKRGQPFFNNVEGKNVVNLNPGIAEVLERGGMNARGVGDVAKAMFMLEAAAKNPANRERKEAFARGENVGVDRPVGYGGDHPALGGGEAKIAMLNREKIEGKEVKAQLQKLDGRRGNPGEPLNQQELGQARMPFQAGIAGQDIPRARFVKGEDRNLSTDQIYEKYGPVNGQIANAVLDRAREETLVTDQPDPIAQEFRQRDQEFEAAGERRNAADNVREVNEAFERMGMSLEGKGQMLLGGQIVPDPRRSTNKSNIPERNIVPQGPLRKARAVSQREADNVALKIKERLGNIDGFSMPKSDPVVAQRTAPMQEALSGITYNELAPDPWSQPVGTGNGIGQEIAKRSTGRSQQALPYGISTSGPAQGPVPGSARKQFTDKARNFGKSPKYERANRYGRRAAYGGGAVAGLAGLDALIGGERDNREQEVYQ
jgi:hypothetical protein